MKKKVYEKKKPSKKNLKDSKRKKVIIIIVVSLIIIAVLITLFLLKFFKKPVVVEEPEAEFQETILKINNATVTSLGNEVLINVTKIGPGDIKNMNVLFPDETEKGKSYRVGREFPKGFTNMIYTILVHELGIFNFDNIEFVIIIYQTLNETGQITNKFVKKKLFKQPGVGMSEINKTPMILTGSGGGGSDQQSCDSKGCGHYPGQCGDSLSDGCGGRIDCSDRCDIDEICYGGPGTSVDVCIASGSECTDSDGGLNYFVNGTVTMTVSGSTYDDFCVGLNLTEYYCYYNSSLGWRHRNWVIVNCSQGCLNGACIPNPLCNDSDGDGYGVCPDCNISSGCLYDGDDCNDSDVSVHPYAQEICDDEKDNDCNLQVDCFDDYCYMHPSCLVCEDNDSDGYGVCPYCGTMNGCAEEGDDCDDDNSSIHPDATEVCDDLIDNNCDLDIDCDDYGCMYDPICGGIPSLGLFKRLNDMFLKLFENIKDIFIYDQKYKLAYPTTLE